MKKIAEWMKKSIFGIGIVFYSWILVLNLFLENITYFCKNKYVIANKLLMVFGIFLINIFIFLFKKYKRAIRKFLERGDELVPIFSVLLFLVELIISYEILFVSGWDAGEVSWQASLVAAGEKALDNSYFSHYPNNLLITFLYSLAYRLMGIVGLQMYGAVIIVIFQCFLSSLTGYLLYQISKKMFHSNKIAFLVWIIYGLWIGLIPWYMVTYSDPVGIIFPVIILWLYQSMDNKKAIWEKSVGIGIVSFFGYQIKPTVLIMYIAILLIVILRFIEKNECNIRIKQICGIVVAFFVVLNIYGHFDIAKCMGFQLDKEQKLTSTHFVMMGLSQKTNGVFDKDEVDFSISFPNKEMRQKANIKVIKQRLHEYGFLGMTKHLSKKILTNYNDGTFSWGKEGEFFLEEIEKPELIFSKVLKSLYYNNGEYRSMFINYMQFIWFMTLFGVFLNFILTFHKKKIADLQLITMLALVGIFLFVTIFEARARYLYIYVPLYILVGVQGYFQLFFSLRRKKKISILKIIVLGVRNTK
ncbi:MAG: hypothetical protein HFJ09_10895 [Lachnospiraceae bacterium]|nr:hypothetical protein [Lachnospiraceae bacterium]